MNFICDQSQDKKSVICFNKTILSFLFTIKNRSPTAEAPVIRSEILVRRYVCEIIGGCAQHPY